MILKVIPLKSRSRNAFYDAIIYTNDKNLLDEVERVWEKMLANNGDTIKVFNFGEVSLLIKPRDKGKHVVL